MTGTIPGVLATTAPVCARQRGPSTYSLNVIEPSSAPGRVELERLVQERRQRVVPLAEVLDRLAAGAQLELDQPEQVVVRVQGVRDPAQVVDLGPGEGRVGDHPPLDGVARPVLAALGARCTVGVPDVAADLDPCRGGQQLALATGEVEPDAVAVLLPHRLP